MTRHAMWRKNRRPAPKGRGTRSIGVDMNRNFPMQWKFERYFAPGTIDSTRNPSDYESMEWGRTHASTPFHSPYREMRKVMREVTAGLLEFCLHAIKHTR